MNWRDFFVGLFVVPLGLWLVLAFARADTGDANQLPLAAGVAFPVAYWLGRVLTDAAQERRGDPDS